MGATGSKGGGIIRTEVQPVNVPQGSSELIRGAKIDTDEVAVKLANTILQMKPDAVYPYGIENIGNTYNGALTKEVHDAVKDNLLQQMITTYGEKTLKGYDMSDFGGSTYTALNKLRTMERKGEKLTGKWSQQTLGRMHSALLGQMYNRFTHVDATNEEGFKKSYVSMRQERKILDWIDSKLKK